MRDREFLRDQLRRWDSLTLEECGYVLYHIACEAFDSLPAQETDRDAAAVQRERTEALRRVMNGSVPRGMAEFQCEWAGTDVPPQYAGAAPLEPWALRDKRDEFFAAALSGLMANPYLSAQGLNYQEMAQAARVAADESMKQLGYDVPARG